MLWCTIIIKGMCREKKLCVCEWIWALGYRCRTGLYCSDVAGAFDRVSRIRLVRLLARSGLHHQIYKVLSSWLDDRNAHVVVDNECSHHFCLRDMVFQGTFLGPPLWNLFFASCRHAVNVHQFIEVVFADDLNCYRKYHADASNVSIFKDLSSSQHSVHDWGKTQQVQFESTKESLHVLCSKQPQGDAFKILGIKFDTKLIMYDAVVGIVAEAGSRLKMLLRVRPFYIVRALVNLYECHVLSVIESGTPTFYHATPTILKLLDEIQNEFLESIAISRVDDLMTFNLAPLGLRRDIYRLGALHRINLGIAPIPLRNLIPKRVSNLRSYGFRNGISYHSKQLQDCVSSNSLVFLKRSLFGLVYIYNRLKQETVDANSVQVFQKRLLCIAKKDVDVNPSWDLMFHRM